MNKFYSEIEKILDYKFKDINLLDEALTHSSIKTNNKNKKVFNYERLEFLGDRILGFVISDLLFKKFPNFQEGDLSILFQKYTNTKFLSKVAISLNLDLLLHLIKILYWYIFEIIYLNRPLEN